MKRNPAKLSDKTYDLLVVGAGIYGASVAWDAALRGLSVALIERGDFGSGNSSSSLKIVHGGLRYLQKLDLARMRTSILERRMMLRAAPHLVSPMPCLMPTYRKLMKSRLIMRAGMIANDIVSYDRNRGIDDPARRIPRGRTVGRAECLRLAPGLDDGVEGLGRITGGAVWYDAMMYNSERLGLAFVQSASQAGAEVANYLEARNYITEGARVTGLVARDAVGGGEVEISARLVLNTVGPGIDGVLGLLRSHPHVWTGRMSDGKRLRLSTAMNLVVNRPILGEHALGFLSPFAYEGPEGKRCLASRALFMVPWRRFTLIGTQHRPFDGDPDGFRPSEEMVVSFIEEINRAYPGAEIKQPEVSQVLYGVIPMEGTDTRSGEVNLSTKPRIIDHAEEDGIDGLLSVVGMKYTTARNVAEQMVDRVMAKLEMKSKPCETCDRQLAGGDIGRMEDFLDDVQREKPLGLEPEAIEHLVRNYGSEYRGIVQLAAEEPELAGFVPGSSEVVMAEVANAVRNEMAVKLADVVLRRTDLGSAGDPGREALDACAGLMAKELGWDGERITAEIEDTRATYPSCG